MIPKECKRLAEVDFPIAVVSKHSAREKSIRHGHPSTLHLWWARRPLAACRAMLLGLLLPDPCDEHCPEDFKDQARKLLRQVPGKLGTSNKDLQQALLRFMGDFANWDRSADRMYLEVSRGLVKAAHPEEVPLVVDPFAGGGSIPLEALRLGCEAFASDLNPVASLIEKVMIEDIPRYGPGLADELRRVGAEVKAAAEKELAKFYPQDPDGARPIAYLWARTVQCESSNCGAEIPLVRSFWLSKKTGRQRATRYHIVRPKGKTPSIEFEIFTPKKDKDVPSGTTARAKATCLCCNTVLSPDRVRAQLREQSGGADVIFDGRGKRAGGARLLAIVTLKPGQQGRNYRLPTALDYDTIWAAKNYLDKIAKKPFANDINPVPDEPLPPQGTLGFRIQLYGMTKWGDLFTIRQKLSLLTFAKIVRKIDSSGSSQDGTIKELLALVVGRSADQLSSLVRWLQTIEAVASTFGRQALPIVWDFCESCPIGDASANVGAALEWIIKVVEAAAPVLQHQGQQALADACASPLPDDSAAIWFTDPPYYDAIPYSDLSDFFYVWLKRTLPGHPLMQDPFDRTNQLTPKDKEAVQDETKRVNGRPKDKAFFEDAMARAFAEGRRILNMDGIGCVVFAHKTTEGWESLLTGLIRGNWVITGSWPIATERSVRIRARESAALATSVHLVCRPRTTDEIGDWGEVLRELPKRVGDWIEKLQAEHIRGADLVFACIGPALEIFSRYSRVETADGKEVPLADYLLKVWEVVGRTALEQVLGTAEAKARNGVAGALEEDARLTALFLWTLQSTNGNDAAESESDEEGDEDEEEAGQKGKKSGYSLIYDVARRFAQPLGIHLEKWEGRIIETQKGVVRLLSVHERAKQLFGEEGVHAVAEQMKHKRAESLQMTLFAHAELPSADERAKPGRKKKTKIEISDDAIETRKIDATTLDRVHAAMLLQAGGQSNALRALLKAEQERGQDFLRLANALSALYPRESEEKRLLDAMLLAVPR